MILPVPVTLNRFFAALRVLIFGISFHSCVLRWTQQHHHVAAVEERLGLDHPDLLDVLGEAQKEVTAALRMGGLPPTEHDRHLDLRALVQKPLDVPLLGVVVMDSDLRAKLDLLHVDLALVLASLLRLLLLLVLVLPVVHDLRYRRIGHRRDLDEIEVLPVGVLAGLVRRLDSELSPVVVDQTDTGHPSGVVDPRRVPVCGTGWLVRLTPRTAHAARLISASPSPTTLTTCILSCWALRSRFPLVSFAASTTHRKRLSASCAAITRAPAVCASPTGRTRICTGAIQKGNAP